MESNPVFEIEEVPAQTVLRAPDVPELPRKLEVEAVSKAKEILEAELNTLKLPPDASRQGHIHYRTAKKEYLAEEEELAVLEEFLIENPGDQLATDRF